MEIISVCLSVCDLVSATKPLADFHEIMFGGSLQKVVVLYGFCEYSNLYFISCPFWVQFGVGHLHVVPLRSDEFSEKWCSFLLQRTSVVFLN
jgi:hypothetical protein